MCRYFVVLRFCVLFVADNNYFWGGEKIRERVKKRRRLFYLNFMFYFWTHCNIVSVLSTKLDAVQNSVISLKSLVFFFFFKFKNINEDESKTYKKNVQKGNSLLRVYTHANMFCSLYTANRVKWLPSNDVTLHFGYFQYLINWVWLLLIRMLHLRFLSLILGF